MFVLGNHEFDFGPEVLASFIGNLTVPVVSCNVHASKDPFLAGKIKPFTIVTLPVSGKKVGIVGFTPPDASVTSSPGKKVTFSDPIIRAPTCISMAKKAGADIVLGVTHVGYSVDKLLAASFGFDAIIGGHSHSFLANAPVPALLISPATPETSLIEGPYPTLVQNTKNGRSIPVATAYWGSRYLGVMDLMITIIKKKMTVSVDNTTTKLVLMGGASSTNNVEFDPTVESQLAELRTPLNALNTAVVGSSAVVLDGERINVRNKETNLGDMITDAMVWHIKTRTSILSKYSTLPYMAHMNGGGIRASIPAGDITRGQVITVLPFGNLLSVKKVSAAQLRAALNNGASQMVGTTSSAGRFAQVARCKYAFNPAASDSNYRIMRAELISSTGAPLDLATYEGDIIVMMNNFIANGGDGYTSFAAAPLILEASIGVDEIVSDYITAFSPVSPITDARIVNCVVDPTNAMCSN